jgi:hypothetical protein
MKATAKIERRASEMRATARIERRASKIRATAKIERRASEMRATARIERPASEIRATAKIERRASEMRATAKIERRASKMKATAKIERRASEIRATAKIERRASEICWLINSRVVFGEHDCRGASECGVACNASRSTVEFRREMDRRQRVSPDRPHTLKRGSRTNAHHRECTFQRMRSVCVRDSQK